MNSSEEFYREKLYPLQDGVLSIVRKLNLPFYLTGGTALGRYYLHHRYSNDLDLFVNNVAKFSQYVQALFAGFEKQQDQGDFAIDYQRIIKTENFTQFFLSRKNTDTIELKIDLVNDIAAHFGAFEWHETLGKLDSWRNILSNKVTCLFRNEAKDLVDIWAIARKYHFNWVDIISEAKMKEAGADPIVLVNIMKSFPTHLLSSVKLIEPINPARFSHDIFTIADNILMGERNTLVT